MQLGADNEMHLIAMHWSSVLKEAIAAAASSLGRFVQPCLNHSKSVYSGKNYSQVENIQDSCSQEWKSQHIYLKFKLCNVYRTCKKNRS